MGFAGLTPLALGGCEGALSTVDPAGPAAAVIATLWWVMLAGATAIFAFVMVLLWLAFRRGADAPAGQAEADAAAAAHEKLWLVRLGLVFPVTVLLALLAYGLVVGERLVPRAGDDVVTVRAEGLQWAWEFGYADAEGLQTRDVLHIPAGRPIDVEITTRDVIHSFWVPRLAGKLDAIPGHVNVLRIEADNPGTYAGRSAEFSGIGYRDHVFSVIAHDAAGWEAFLRDGPALPPRDPGPEAGATVPSELRPEGPVPTSPALSRDASPQEPARGSGDAGADETGAEGGPVPDPSDAGGQDGTEQDGTGGEGMGEEGASLDGPARSAVAPRPLVIDRGEDAPDTATGGLAAGGLAAGGLAAGGGTRTVAIPADGTEATQAGETAGDAP